MDEHTLRERSIDRATRGQQSCDDSNSCLCQRTSYAERMSIDAERMSADGICECLCQSTSTSTSDANGVTVDVNIMMTHMQAPDHDGNHDMQTSDHDGEAPSSDGLDELPSFKYLMSLDTLTSPYNVAFNNCQHWSTHVWLHFGGRQTWKCCCCFTCVCNEEGLY